MNPAFKFNFDNISSTQPDAVNAAEGSNNAAQTTYTEIGYNRNVCFIWPDGKRFFLSYSYLVSSQYLPEENTIIIEFTTHTIKLMGLNLLRLYDELMFQVAMRITCIYPRYNTLEGEDQPVINDIQLVVKE